MLAFLRRIWVNNIKQIILIITKIEYTCNLMRNPLSIKNTLPTHAINIYFTALIFMRMQQRRYIIWILENAKVNPN